MNAPDVAIIGAGIGGLACALALRQRGIEARIYEQTRDLGEIGAGIHISPNGMKVLTALGLRAALDHVAARPVAIVTRHYSTGEKNFEGPLDAAFEARFGAPFFSFHRADLHGILVDAVRSDDPSCIRLDHRAVMVEERLGDAVVTFADDNATSADVVVAGDGVHSRVRAALHGGSDARFTGHVAYRGMVSRAEVPADLVEPKLTVWVGPGAHFVAYPVRRGELINYVALVEERGWQDESWTTKADKATLSGVFESWNETVRTLVDFTLKGECYKWALLVRDPLPCWSTARTTLLGDAAHPMVPYLAQGAVMAVEDAWVLAACLAADEDTAAALRRYETARLARTSRVQDAAWAQGQMNHAVGRGGDDFRGGGFADPAWIYGYDAVALFPPADS